MKKFFLSLVALICATVSFAQNQIATLTHGDEIKTFYGPGSFVQAMGNAQSGDVISLSSGTFTATNIYKGVTIRGAGMVAIEDSLGYHAPTIISGAFDLSKSDSTRIQIEGVRFANKISYFKVTNAKFSKCYIEYITNASTTSPYIKATLTNCRVNNISIICSSSVTCVNSCIDMCSNRDEGDHPSFAFINCILSDFGRPNTVGDHPKITNSIFQNSYLSFYDKNLYALPSSNKVSYCYSNYDGAFAYTQDMTNKVVSELDVFDSFTGGEWDDSEKFLLKEHAAQTYLGNDGTQMGIYGGMMPYEEKMPLPRIIKCNVAGKSTADGKLSVDIQVEAAQ